jgi:fatty acid synthase subunit alpha
MRNRNLVVKVETINQRGEKIIEGAAEVAQPPTVCLHRSRFSGAWYGHGPLQFFSHGPRCLGCCGRAFARRLWLLDSRYRKHNPKDKTIHFGGIKGQAIRQRYIDMTFDTLNKDGNVKTLPLFTDINVRTQHYMFSHPNGLLFATQFAQIALVVTEKATFDDMCSKGLIQRDSAFAGHSLGEYSALASIADVLPISSLVGVVFYHGIMMQSVVERDLQDRSNYAVCAVNPSRISKTFEAALCEVVEIVGTRTGALLEIVNYNIDVCVIIIHRILH